MSATYQSENVFAKIIRGEIPCQKVYEDESTFAFRDIQPAAPVHILVVPKGEYCSFHDFSLRAAPEAMSHFFQVIQQIAEKEGLAESGYRLITNHGADASQSVPHFHVHLLGGKALGELLSA
jgi:diadenosine tetraphosphate (Ap4A) HIT family hydrolase